MQAATASPAAVHAFLLLSFKKTSFYKSKIKFVVTLQVLASYDGAVCILSTYGVPQKKKG